MSEARGLEFPVGVVLLGNKKIDSVGSSSKPVPTKIFEALNRVDPSLGSLLLLAAAAAAAAYRLRTADFSFLLPGRAFLCKFSSEMKKEKLTSAFENFFCQLEMCHLLLNVAVTLSKVTLGLNL